MPASWATLEQPILNAIAGLEDPDMDEVIAVTGLAKPAVQTGLRRLVQAGYVAGIEVTAMGTGFEMIQIELLERGLRVTGLWPRDAYEEFVRIVGEAIAREPDPVKRTKLEEFLSSMGGVGRDVVTTLIVDALKRTAGL
jgi:hypothetical protein